ncbi:MAG TPA: GNAT family N-acetyltransferase [Mycobacteriales bacterium]|nr:GNAT family N-acetyltransferase [Mycobacteriales bacterium]
MTETSAPPMDGVRRPSAPVSVVEVRSEREARAAVEVLAEVWRRDDGQPPLPPELAWAFAHSGNYVALATAGDEPVAAAIGFRGEDAGGPLLHSHIAGVLPAWQGSGVGYLIKQHQRSWAIAHGLDRITWTFDPLVSRNAYFNVVKLGAQLTRYYVDFYGRMNDGINDGDETDRCLVTWRLTSRAAVAAAARRYVAADVAGIRATGAADLLVADSEGAPKLTLTDADVRLVQVPVDIVGIRRREPGTAQEWRRALRRALVPAFEEGLEVVGVSRDSWYVVARP